MIEKILPAFADGDYCICVFLDFSACFDTINKLERYGVGGDSLQFVKSYFSNRKQYVVYSGVNSCLLYTSPSPRDKRQSRMPSSA